MIPLKPRDNALFVRNFRERMRPHIIGSYAAILFATVMMFFMIAADIFAETGRQNALFPLFLPRYVPAEILAVIAVFQGAVLLFLGTLSAYRMTLQDRFNGTLDFFRATSTKGLDHVLGLVFGSALTEWYFFLLLVPVTFVLALLSDVKFAALAELYASIAVCAVFYHSLGVLAGLCTTSKKYRAGIKTFLFAALFCGLTVALILIKSSVAYHGTFLPAYVNLLTGSLDSGTAFVADFLNYQQHIFFGKLLPSPVFQALVQVPLCALVWLAIKRKLSSAETPLLSKFQLALLIALFLFYCTGDSLVYAELRLKANAPKDLNHILFFYNYLFFFLAGFFSLITAPSALAYRKGVNRALKLGLRKPGWFDEQNGNAAWTAILCLLFAAVYAALCARFKVPFSVTAASFAALAVHIAVFAGAYEFFNLSRFRGKTVIFATALLIVWIALPVTEAILFGLRHAFFVWFSPLFGLLIWGGRATTLDPSNMTLQQFLLKLTDVHQPFPDLNVFLLILANYYLLALAGFFMLLAARERKRIRTAATANHDAPEGGI